MLPRLARTRVLLAAALPLALAASVTASAPARADIKPGSTSEKRAPVSIDLPDGFQPEGIAIGPPRMAWFGSRATGDIYRASLKTGEGEIISKGPGTPSLGMKIDARGRLFVAGGTGGDARVIDSRTGRVLRSYTFVDDGSAFINDVVLTKGAAFFTDSNSAQLFKVPLNRRGTLAGQAKVERLPLRGEWEQSDDLSANGITTTPDGRFLLMVNSTSGDLYRVPRGNGRATKVDVRGTSLTNGDGMLRLGTTLYVVRNQMNKVATLKLAANGATARLTDQRFSPRFDVPTTIARSAGGLFLPNARFSTEPTPSTTYTANRIPIHRFGNKG